MVAILICMYCITIKGNTNEIYQQQIDSLRHLASERWALGNCKNALAIKKEILRILRDAKGETSVEYIDELRTYSWDLYSLGILHEAIKYGMRTLDLQRQTIGDAHPEYATTLSNVAVYNADLGNLEKAIRLESKAIDIRNNTLDKNHPDIASSLHNLGTYYYELGDYKKSLRFAQLDWAIQQSINIIDSDYASSAWTLGYIHYILGDYEESIKYANIANSAYESIDDCLNIDIANSLYLLSLSYQGLGEYSQSIDLAMRSLKIMEENGFQEYVLEYSKCLDMISQLYLNLGSNDLAIAYGRRALEVLKDRDKSIQYYTTLHNLAICYRASKQYTAAIELEKESRKFRRKRTIDNSISAANFALCYVGLRQFNKAVKMGRKALGGLRVNNESRYHSHIKDIVALVYSYANKDKEALKLREEVLKSMMLQYGEYHPFYTNALERQCLLYYKMGEFDTFYEMWEDLYQLRMENVKKYFTSLDSNNRTKYWSSIRHYYKSIIPYYSFIDKSNRMIGIAYDAALLSKGVLLHTDAEYSKVLSQCGDENVVALYNKLREIRSRLYKIYERSLLNDKAYADSLEFVAMDIENQLINKTTAYEDVLNSLSINWRQVQNKLQKDEIAIEFLSFPMGNDSVMYSALILKRDYVAPRMIPLFESKQLEVIDSENYYKDATLSTLLWKPIDEELKDVTKIFFALDGELNNIAVESLPHYEKDGYMFDSWNLYRLSSTRELVRLKSQPNETQVVLYGGIRYDMNTQYMEVVHDTISTTRNKSRVNLDSIGIRGRSYGPLIGSLVEVESIKDLCLENSIQAVLYEDSMASEFSLKQLDGKGISIIHISTHGFYWPESELTNNPLDVSIIGRDNMIRYLEHKPMTRTGLLFAGANQSLSETNIPEGREDGVLTAMEVSTLDFYGLDLLVLSACQTGVGEIKGDGVYGLQRGFKMAGAQTMVMSLWDVDDDATQLLMTEFYRRYLSGEPKYESFIRAQEYVRNFSGKIRGKDKDLSDPYYWAGFVMIDACN